MILSKPIISGQLKSTTKCLVAALITAFTLQYSGVFMLLNADEVVALTRAAASTLAQVAATMAGFILTALAIMSALTDKAIIKKMYRSGHAIVLYLRMYAAITLCAFTCAFGVFIMIRPNPTLLSLYILLGASAAFSVSLVSVMRKIWVVLILLGEDAGTDDGYEVIDHGS